MTIADRLQYRHTELLPATAEYFVRLRELLASHQELARKLDELEKKFDEHFQVVFEAIRHLMSSDPPEPKRRFGFSSGKDE